MVERRARERPELAGARFFDIDWAPVKAELHAKLLLPILGDQYGQVLERGDGFCRVEASLYFEHELPINPRQAAAGYRRAVD